MIAALLGLLVVYLCAQGVDIAGAEQSSAACHAMRIGDLLEHHTANLSHTGALEEASSCEFKYPSALGSWDYSGVLSATRTTGIAFSGGLPPRSCCLCKKGVHMSRRATVLTSRSAHSQEQLCTALPCSRPNLCAALLTPADLPGFTRSVYERDHALVTPESRVFAAAPAGWWATAEHCTSHCAAHTPACMRHRCTCL